MPQAHTKYDPALMRRTIRKGREKGCWVYVPAQELRQAGVDPEGPPPLCRVWGRSRGSVLVRLYDATRFCTSCGRLLNTPTAYGRCSLCEPAAPAATV